LILEDIKNIKSEKSDLRKFGLTVGIVLAVLGAVLLWRQKDFYRICFIASAPLIVLGLVLPVVLKPIQKVWMTLAILMGWVMTRVLLILLFFVIVTPIGFVAKIFGKDFLNRKFQKDQQASYWIKRKPIPFNQSLYENQY